MSDPVHDNNPGKEPGQQRNEGQSPAELFRQLIGANFRPASDFGSEPAVEPAYADVPLLHKTFLIPITPESEQCANPEASEPAIELTKDADISPKTKEYIEAQYATFRATLKQRLDKIERLTSYPADGLGDRNQSILTEIDLRSPNAHALAIFQMSYAKTWSQWTKNLDANSPEFLTINSFLRNVEKASNAFDTAALNIDTIDTTRLSQHYRFGFHPVSASFAPRYNSVSNLFMSAVTSTLEDSSRKIATKKQLFDAIEANSDLKVMPNDRGATHPFRSEEEQETDSFYFLNVHETRAAFAEVAQTRASLVLDGDIYIKPTEGAGSVGVRRISYNQESETLTISTKTEMPAEIFHTQKPVLRAFLNGDLSQMKSTPVEGSGADIGHWEIELVDGTRLTTAMNIERDFVVPEASHMTLKLTGMENPVLTNFFEHGEFDSCEPAPENEGEEPAWLVTLENDSILRTTSDPESDDFAPDQSNTRVITERPTEMKCTCAPFLKDFDFQTTGEGTYAVHVPPDKLPEFFTGLEIAAIDNTGRPTFAEGGIPTELLHGNTWEIRQINQAGNLDAILVLSSPEETLIQVANLQAQAQEDYVKLSSNSYISSLSQGDTTGRVTTEVLEEVLRQIDPDITEDEIDEIIDDLTRRRFEAVGKIQAVVSDYLTELKEELLADCPLERIPADNFSTDFMIIFSIDEESGKVTDTELVLVDINFNYAYEGLKSVDSLGAISTTLNLQRLRNIVALTLNSL